MTVINQKKSYAACAHTQPVNHRVNVWYFRWHTDSIPQNGKKFPLLTFYYTYDQKDVLKCKKTHLPFSQFLFFSFCRLALQQKTFMYTQFTHCKNNNAFRSTINSVNWHTIKDQGVYECACFHPNGWETVCRQVFLFCPMSLKYAITLTDPSTQTKNNING